MSAVTVDQTLEVIGLSKYFDVPGSEHFWQPRRKLHAVDDVSFTLRPGRITALVGESGSGKTTVARLIARLYEPTAGEIVFEGRPEPKHVNREANLRYRRQVQMIFQDPFDSLNPVKTVAHLIGRPLRIHKIVPRDQERDRILNLLDTVGLVPAEVIADKYPHELSGGQRQRVAIARALAVEPRVILADEPTSMLDVSIRIGVLNLMLRLKDEHDLAFLFVTHDLASARYVADELLVMYAGQIVEHGPTEEVLADPLHPYTRLLISAAPDPNAGLGTRTLAARTPKDLAVEDEGGCRFVGRCPLAIDICSNTPPVLVEAGRNRWARCHVTAPGGTV